MKYIRISLFFALVMCLFLSISSPAIAAEEGTCGPNATWRFENSTLTISGTGVVTGTPDRSTLQAVQTPQVFDFDLLRGALQKAKADGAAITDDCSAVERLGMSVRIVAGDEKNIKITTPLDLKIAELLLEEGL